MQHLSESDIEEILSSIRSRTKDSNLGFFSKPFLVDYHGESLVVKQYLPIKDPQILNFILENHSLYIQRLKEMGVLIPSTRMVQIPAGTKTQIIIIQEAFKSDELLRNKIQSAGESELMTLCSKAYDQVILYGLMQGSRGDIGYHPSLRNLAYRADKTYYYDTFPPMAMEQQRLNDLIITMAPFGRMLKPLINPKWINRVSDEYYYFDKMYEGVVGSCCRLRPELASLILEFSKDYLGESQIDPFVKQAAQKLLQKPPRLSGLWTGIRSLSGNEGKPNIS